MSDWHHQQIAEARRVAQGIPSPQRNCGDILDRLPCVECGAASIRNCPLTLEQAKPVCDLINSTAYLGDVLRREADRRRPASGGRGDA